MRGRTIITTDGTTLLGADDKAGLAVIMETAAWLTEHPEIEHGPIRICFTCDEEIGHGVDYVDLEALGAVVGYTLDGQGADEIDVETFSADLATVTVTGVNIHPSIAKGRMINALRVAGIFARRLPDWINCRRKPPAGGKGSCTRTPSRGASAEVDAARCCCAISRPPKLGDTLAGCPSWRGRCEAEFPGARVTVDCRPQYRNLADGLVREPRAVAFAEKALRRLGRDSPADDRPRRHRRLAAHRAGAADAEPFLRPAQSPLAAGMGLPGGNGRGRRNAGDARPRLGRSRRPGEEPTK